MTVVDDETSRLWQLLAELSQQLSANKEHCEALKRQAEQLKTQAIHTGTGFTLRRFNTDITKEQFESELERFNATLILENQALQYENRQLSMLLKDYEGTLDNVMAKFRTFAHSSQQYELESARHYETLLLQYGHDEHPAPVASTSALPTNPVSAPLLTNNTAGGSGTGNSSNLSFAQNLSQQQQSLQQAQAQILGMRPAVLDVQDPLALQWSLAHLSSLIRKALRSIQGEDDISSSDDSSEGVDAASSSSSEEEEDDHDNAGDTYRPRTPAPQSSTKATSPEAEIPSVSQHPIKQNNNHHHHHHHHHHRNSTSKHDEGEGGYLRLLLNSGFDKSSAALERDIELERLKKENEALREMLGVASELPSHSPSTTAPAATVMAISSSSTSSR